MLASRLGFVIALLGLVVTAACRPTTPSTPMPEQVQIELVPFDIGGQDSATGIVVDRAGNLYVVGVTNDAFLGQTSLGGGNDAFVRKYGPVGTELWTRQFGSQEWEIAWDVAVDGEGNLYVVGETHGALPGQTNLVDTVHPQLVAGGYAGPPYGIPDAFLRKYDGGGNELWTRQFGNQLQLEVGVHGVAVDAAGNVYVAGWTNGLPGPTYTGSFKALVSKYDSDGNALWTRQFGATGSDFAEDVAVDATGNAYVVGRTYGDLSSQTYSGEGYIDAFVRKYDSNGRELWTQQFGTPTHEEARRAVVVDGAGDLYVVGGVTGALPGQAYLLPSDAFVRKYDSEGNELWTRQFGTGGHDSAQDVAVDGAGNLYVVGSTFGALPGQTNLEEWGSTDAFVRKYDRDGKELWTRQFGTRDNEQASGVGVDSAGNLYVVGLTTGALPGQTNLEEWRTTDAFVRKYDRDGKELWTRQFGT